jgi:hypothetical protein
VAQALLETFVVFEQMVDKSKRRLCGNVKESFFSGKQTKKKDEK